jgi:hypothetical protein
MRIEDRLGDGGVWLAEQGAARGQEHSPLFDTHLWTEHLHVSIRLAWESQLYADRAAKRGGASGYHVVVRPKR